RGVVHPRWAPRSQRSLGGDTRLVGLLRSPRGRHRHRRGLGVLGGRRARRPDRRMKPRHGAALVLLAASLTAVVTALPAHADSQGRRTAPGEPTADPPAAAGIPSRTDASAISFEPEVLNLEPTTTQQGQTTVTLSVEILFAPDSWDLAP